MAETRLLPESVAPHNEIIRALKEREIEAAMKGLEPELAVGREGLPRNMGNGRGIGRNGGAADKSVECS
jgi:hypothetical protein